MKCRDVWTEIVLLKRSREHQVGFALISILLPLFVGSRVVAQDFANFESLHVHPLDIDPSGDRVLAVNTADIGLLLADWGPCSPQMPCPADFDGNGLVDAADLGILLASWTLNP